LRDAARNTQNRPRTNLHGLTWGTGRSRHRRFAITESADSAIGYPTDPADAARNV